MRALLDRGKTSLGKRCCNFWSFGEGQQHCALAKNQSGAYQAIFIANLDYEPNGRQILNSLQEEWRSAEEFFQLNLVLIEPRELQHRRP